MDIAKLQAAAEHEGFSGAVRIRKDGQTVGEFASGMADRANERPNQLTTRFGVASVAKGLTAMSVMSLIEAGELHLDTPLVSVVGDVLPLVDPAVTIEHLLTHRSGVGDYVDEAVLQDIDDYVLGDRSAHTLRTSADYLDLLNAHGQQTPPGSEFAYNNSGFVMLSLAIEKLTGSFHDAVKDRVLDPAGITDGGFLRTDELPGDVALGYLQDGRTNVFHLPVIGAGDGGAYLSLDDALSLWTALFDGRIITVASVDLMTEVTTNRGDRPSYGRGLLLDTQADHVWLEGMDAGVSSQTGVVRSRGISYAVLANTSGGAWNVARAILAAN